MTPTVIMLTLFGAVMLILYGMRLAGDGLQKAAGGKLRSFLLTATSNRFKGIGVGALITAIFQSSSATTVMLVGFVGSGLLGLGETMGVILGADIGTTMTVQIIAFKVYDYAIAFVGIGIAMMFLSGKGHAKQVGQAVLGFGLVFFGLKVMIDAFAPMAENPVMRNFLLSFSSDPYTGIIISTLLTALFHSSAATLGLAITAAHSGLLTLDAAMPIVLGANIGTCASAIVSSFGANTDAKRVALSHILFKVIGVIIVLPFIGVFTGLVAVFSGDLARQVALAHTFFNIALALAFLPFIAPFTRLVKLLLPEVEAPTRFGPKYLDPIVLSSPALALVQAGREALRAADVVHEMLKKAIDVFTNNDSELLERIEAKDDDVDLLDKEIKIYLTKITKESLSDEQAGRQLEIMLFSDNIENIGDVIDKNLMDLARKKIKNGCSFSKDGLAEIITLHKKVVENFELGVAAFASSDESLAQKLVNHKARVSEIERELRESHINRLHKGLRETIDTSAIHLDVLTNLKRINSCITNAVYPILEKKKS